MFWARDPASCERAVQLFAGADFGPASDTLAYTFLEWAEAAQL